MLINTIDKSFAVYSCKTSTKITLNSRTYTQTYTATVVQSEVGGGGGLQLSLWVFPMLQYLENILPLIDSLSCDVQDKVNIRGYGTA